MLQGSIPTWLAISAVFAAVAYRMLARQPGCVSFSLHPLCPAFISGAYAAYKLGADETAFLLHLQETYGDMVYLPFPLAQYFVLSDAIVRQIYNGSYNKELSFLPIRKMLSGIIFGVRTETWQGPTLEKHIFPNHAKAMTKAKLAGAIERFADYADTAVAKQAASMKGHEGPEIVNLIDFAFEVMFSASVVALFGTELPLPLEQLKQWFLAFDHAFPLLASGKIPGWLQPRLKAGGVAAGIDARDKMNAFFGKWGRDTGCAGLREDDVIRITAEDGLRLGFDDTDLGSMMLGDFWALLANNPFAACWVLVYISQADEQLLADLYAEIDSIPEGVSAFDAQLPLLQSCFYETLRMQTSTFSIRWCSQPVNLENRALLQPGDTVVCVTRTGHLDRNIWGEDARLWDGRRFFDDPKNADGLLKGSKASQIPFVRAFGGGISIVRVCPPA